jgi:hypothetical protein
MWLRLPPDTFAALLARLAVGVDREGDHVIYAATGARWHPPWPVRLTHIWLAQRSYSRHGLAADSKQGAGQYAGAATVLQGTDMRSVRRPW